MNLHRIVGVSRLVVLILAHALWRSTIRAVRP